MSWRSMSLEIAGNVPCPYPLVKTYVSRAWQEIQRQCMWSFLWGDAAIATPNPIGAGSVTTQIGSNQVIGDATASAAWAAVGLVNPLTTQQFRVGQGTIYNIIGYDPLPNAPFGTLTLDKIFVDPPGGATSGYQILGVYYTAPVQDFLWFDGVLRDPVSGYTIGVDKTRQEIDDIDPQRFQSGWPNEVIPYAVNQQPGTFYGFPMFELWPAPLNGFVYVGGYTRSGMPFVNLTDTVTPPLQEDIVIELASIKAYEWCLVNPDKCPKGDFRFAMGKADKKYNELLNKYMIMDEEISGRNVIPSQQGIGRSDCPWVSQAESVGYFP